ncbi:efflux RND transporter periplasmic adaptor subunit [Chitinivorax sp. B]|uniref:efflux RND transporter periplasmic adaptor subunit n=1 Tax=Chitinivorax sp. B TaxID=2502235 RepID=UPI0010F97C32|nr:efflux RND transporter periplasmic adaptor subunit [Chitinivorax sp. B]
MKTRSLLITSLLGTALLIAIGFVLYPRTDQSVEARYRTQPISRGELIQLASATGTLNPVRVVNVGTQVSGTVRKLYVDYNTPVKAGQILLELDTEPLLAKLRQSQAALASNQAKLTLAKVKNDRLHNLFKQEYISRQELDQAEADLATTQAALAQSAGQVDTDQYNLKNAVIRSPIDGVVIDKVVDEGQTVAASFQTPTLIKIAQDLTRMQINARFAEADLGRIREGLQAAFRVDAFPNQSYRGVVRQVRLNPTTEQNVVTYDVVVNVDNADQMLLPGMTAYVDIELGRRDQALRVPNAALRFRPDVADMPRQANNGNDGANRHGSRGKGKRQPQVYVLRHGELQAVPIKPGLTDGRQTEVLESALQEGEQVVLGTNRGSDQHSRPNPATPMMRRF